MRRTTFPQTCDTAGPRQIGPALDAALNRLLSPFTILGDTREQDRWNFKGLRAGAAEGYAQIDVQTALASLDCGDYTLRGHEEEIRIERKSAPDLFGTLTRGRDRFEAELEKLDRIAFAAVIVEADFSSLVTTPPTNMNVRSFVGSVAALSTRFKAKWFFCGNRRMAEGFAFRLFERWVRDRSDERTRKVKRRRHVGAAS